MDLNENSSYLSEVDMDSDIDEEKMSIIRILNDLKVARVVHSRASLNSDCPATSSYIESWCPSPELSEQEKVSRAVQLNLLLDEKLKELSELLIDRLVICQQKLKEIEAIKRSFKKETKETPNKFIKSFRSYFKDKQNFPPPDNEDTVYMINNQMYDFREVSTVHGWTIKDQRNFVKMIRTMSEEIAVRNLNSQVAQLNRDYEHATKREKKDIKDKIATLENDIRQIHKKELKDIALPIHEDYDWERVNKFLERHTPQEYECLWKIFLHPSINKNKWTSEEHTSLQKIAAINNHENWEKIAIELNTGRTAYQCFVYYRTNVIQVYFGQKWTPEEEQYLMRLIKYYQEGKHINWGKVASCIENRTKMQIYNKYFRLLETRKGRFMQEEDAVILKGVEEYGLNYKDMQKFLPGRSVAQLRVRHRLLQRNEIISWTTEEDKKLMTLMSNKNFKGGFSNVAQHLPGKDRISIRSRYNTLMKWMKANPNLDLSEAPRRTRRADKQQAIEKEDFVSVIRKLQQRLKCENEYGDLPGDDVENVDDAITRVILSEDDGIFRDVEDKFQEALVKDGHVIDATNLKKLFFLLKASFDREQFKNSMYSEKYPSLLEKEHVLTVKSYSRKKTINTKNCDCGLDLWGNTKLDNLEYVFPPNLATMYGLIRLMKYCNENNENKCALNLSALMRKNPEIREPFYLLQERFTFLFLWPLVLGKKLPKNFTPCRASSNNQSRSSENYNVDSSTAVDAIINSENDRNA